jgi:outer membrane protein insertion porin family
MVNDKSIRLSTFVDGGMIGDSYSFGQARTSVGFAASYVSPFGPIKLSFAQPVKSDPSDKLQRIQFQFGQQF